MQQELKQIVLNVQHGEYLNDMLIHQGKINIIAQHSWHLP